MPEITIKSTLWREGGLAPEEEEDLRIDSSEGAFRCFKLARVRPK